MNAPAHGYVAFLLHAHLPYVRQGNGPATLEERWFCEAVADVYLPLIDMMERLQEEDVRFRLTISVSPTLLGMLEDPVMQDKTRKYLAARRELAQKEALRLWGDADFFAAARLYAHRFPLLEQLYSRLEGNLIGKLRILRDSGCIELITCAATHAFLPLIGHDAALRAQLEAAVTEFERHFAAPPAGIWLPECGYTPALEPHLRALGLRWFVAAAHALPQASGAPLRTPGGACAFALDPEASTQVWSAESGYPGDADYREYYRDIGFELGRDGGPEWDYIKPYMLPDGERAAAGLKYYRITGRNADAKRPYRPERAARKARLHARQFAAARTAQLRRLSASSPAAPPVIVCPFDAELFGHWWYEGSQWLEAVLREIGAQAPSGGPQDAAGQAGLQTIALTEYARLYPPAAEAQLPVSSWGRGGCAQVWLQPDNAWALPRLHEAEDRLIGAVRIQPLPDSLPPLPKRLLNQAARELMLAQSSDWTFMLDAGSFPAYGAARIERHLGNVHLLLNALDSLAAAKPGLQEEAIESLLLELETKTGLLPRLAYTCYTSEEPARTAAPAAAASLTSLASPTALASPSAPKAVAVAAPATATAPTAPAIAAADAASAAPAVPLNDGKLRILMLAWEYPPRVIGGLARAVCDLSRQLALSGHEVHVLTCQTEDCPAYERAEGVHVHRVAVLQSLEPLGFLDWIFQLNMAFGDAIAEWSAGGLRFDVLHAHDWLVYYAAKEAKQSLGLPLVATIHATEHGRRLGRLDTELQQRIHALEGELAQTADRLIVCSQPMADEVSSLFQVPEERICRIPNGVFAPPAFHPQQRAENRLLREALAAAGHDKIICFLGRLVHEKGVHTLIQAVRLVLKRVPAARLIIAGAGPAAGSLQAQAASLGTRVCFTGFLEDADKFLLLRHAALCVFPSLYEPFGIVALEAMASGAPLIVSDAGGLAGIVAHGIDGCIVPAGDARRLAEQTAELLLAPRLARRLAEAAVHKARTAYAWPAIGDSTVEAYRHALRLSAPEAQTKAPG